MVGIRERDAVFSDGTASMVVFVLMLGIVLRLDKLEVCQARTTGLLLFVKQLCCSYQAVAAVHRLLLVVTQLRRAAIAT